MNKKLLIIFLCISGLALIGIGLILDRVGGYGVRTDDVSSSVSLSFSEPMLIGVPLTVRWQGESQGNIGVLMRLIAENDSIYLGKGQLYDRSMNITLPCSLRPGPLRLELLDATTKAILAVSPVSPLPLGPDCVR